MRRTLITVLSITAFVLLSMGIIVLASASSEQSIRLHGNPHELLYKQLVWAFLGLLLALKAQNFDYHHFKLVKSSFRIGKYRFCQVPMLTIILFVVVVVALVLVYVPGIGLKINGSRRWLDLKFFRLQPSELAKIVMIIAMSVWLDRIGTKARSFVKGTVLSCLILVPVAGLIIFQRDLGATLIVSLLAVSLMVVAGVNLLHLTVPSFMGVCVGGIYIINLPNVLARLEDWRNSEQLLQSLLTIKIGGLSGVGFTNSLQKYRYLPESHTDFVFPIGAEEFGLTFSLVVVLLFLVILICGVLISCNAEDRLGSYIAFGLTFLIVFQGMFNLMVVTGMVPTKGVALPFFSYGGTSIFSIMIAVGMLLNVARHIGKSSEDKHTQSERDIIHTT